MRLGLPNQIVVVESNSDFKFDHGFQSDSDFNKNFESMITISILFDLFWLKDQFRDQKTWFNDGKSQLNNRKSQFYI